MSAPTGSGHDMPAFPTGNWLAGEQDGMSLRDFFAAAALGGIIASARTSLANPTYEDVAAHAWAQADAMLAARGDGGDE